MALLSCENDDLVAKLEKESSIYESKVAEDNVFKEVYGPIYKDENTATAAGNTSRTTLSDLKIESPKSKITPADLASLGFMNSPDNAINNFYATIGPNFPLPTTPSNVHINEWSALPSTFIEKNEQPFNVPAYKQFFGAGMIQPRGPVRNWSIDETIYKSTRVNRSNTAQLIGGDNISIRLISKGRKWEMSGVPGTALKLESQISFQWILGDDKVTSAPIEKGKEGSITTVQSRTFQTPKVLCPAGHEVVYNLMSRWQEVNTKYRIVVMFTGNVLGVWLYDNLPPPKIYGTMSVWAVPAEKFFYTYGVQPGDLVYSLLTREQASKEYMISASVRKSNP